MNPGPRISRDEWAIRLAVVTSARSTCLRRSVGCVLLDVHGGVLATGYNGVARGRQHCNESEQSWAYASDVIYPHACVGARSPSGTALDSCEAIHAEQNALLQCADVRQIHTTYVTCSPCVTCAKLMLNTGCQKVVFLEEYPQPEARELWERSGREWVKHEGAS